MAVTWTKSAASAGSNHEGAISESASTRADRIREATGLFGRFTFLTVTIVLLALGSTVFAQRSTNFTYSYSNLFDDGLSLSGGFTEYRVLQAVEEAMAVWATHAPLNFVERPDAGPRPINDNDYNGSSAPTIRIGHHDLDDQTLAHAYYPATGFFANQNGLASDIHVDSSSRFWNESLFFTTFLHELGHALGIDHIDEQTSVMNSTLNPNTMFNSITEGKLYSPEIMALQNRWGVGAGSVRTTRTWNSPAPAEWSSDVNWKEGWHPTRFSDVTLNSNSAVHVKQTNQAARSVQLAGQASQLTIGSRGQLLVSQDVVLGTPGQGNPLLAVGAPTRFFIPTSAADESTWYRNNFDDSAWSAGNTGVGYERGTGFESYLATNVEAEMFNRANSIYIRSEFTVDDPQSLDFLNLRMMYDDGFVAYLNGVRVATANVPNTIRWNSTSPSSRDDQAALDWVAFDLTDQRHLLLPGKNLLAIQGVNNRPSSSDLLMLPEITGGTMSSNLVVEGGLLELAKDLRLGQVAGSEGHLRVAGGMALINGNIVEGAGRGRITLEHGLLRASGGRIQAREVVLKGGLLEAVRTIEGDVRQAANNFLIRDVFAAEDKRPTLTVAGTYTMDAGATLELRIAAKTDRQPEPALRVTEAQLAGALNLRGSPDSLENLEPREPGQTVRFWLIESSNPLRGQFDQLQFNDGPLASAAVRGVFQQVTLRDREVFWELYRAYPGDATGDGYFDSFDLVRVFQFGQYEDELPENSSWLQGDWTGDLEFTSSDLIAAFQTGRFEQPANGVSALSIPEPCYGAAMFLWIVPWVRRRGLPRRILATSF